MKSRKPDLKISQGYFQLGTKDFFFLLPVNKFDLNPIISSKFWTDTHTTEGIGILLQDLVYMYEIKSINPSSGSKILRLQQLLFFGGLKCYNWLVCRFKFFKANFINFETAGTN